MSDINDTAVSPEATAEVKPRDTVLIQHLQRWAGVHTVRASRGGHRRQGVVLDDGTRIRQKAYRKTEMSIETLAQNHQSILEHVRQGRVALFDHEEKELSYDDVVKLLTKSGVEVNEESLKEQILNVSAPVPPPELDENGEPKLQVVEAPMVHGEPTNPNMELSATLAAVDMAEENKKLPVDHVAEVSIKKSSKKARRE